jgi:hypothetical protein
VYLERLQRLEAEMSVISKKMHSSQTVLTPRQLITSFAERAHCAERHGAAERAEVAYRLAMAEVQSGPGGQRLHRSTVKKSRRGPGVLLQLLTWGPFMWCGCSGEEDVEDSDGMRATGATLLHTSTGTAGVKLYGREKFGRSD